jgi:hypothetical protein
MENPHDHHIAPGDGEFREPDKTAPRSLFADDAPMPRPPDNSQLPQQSTGRPKFGVFTRLVLPVVILIVGIACIAWVTQYLPSRGRSQQIAKTGVVGPDAILFKPATFVWDPNDQGQPKDKDYIVPEFELGIGGHYDYQFSNTSSGDVDLGVSQTSCTCFGVDACVFQTTLEREEYVRDKESPQLKWTRLEIDKDLRHKVTVPAQASGVLRIAWNGNRTEPEHVLLKTRVWSRADQEQEPSTKELSVYIDYVQPARFQPEKIDFGTLGPKDERTASFVCWSATRELDLKPAVDDNLLKVVIKKLDTNQCEKLQKDMREHQVMTRVRSAYHVTMTLFEENAGQQLALGLFLKPAPLAITSEGQPLDVPLPMLRASVLGDVALGPGEEGGRIDLNIFPAKFGKTKKVTLFSPKGAELSFVGCDPVLLDLDVALKKVKTVADKTQWQMDVTAKPNRDPGLLPENAVLVLRCNLPAEGAASGTTRMVRIPVVGTAESRH